MLFGKKHRKDGSAYSHPINPKQVRDLSDDDTNIDVNINVDNEDDLEKFARERASDEFAKWGTYAAKYNLLTNKQRRLILDDIGVSKDLNLYGNLPFDVFNKEVQEQIIKQLDKIEEANLRNDAWTH